MLSDEVPRPVQSIRGTAPISLQKPSPPKVCCLGSATRLSVAPPAIQPISGLSSAGSRAQFADCARAACRSRISAHARAVAPGIPTGIAIAAAWSKAGVEGRGRRRSAVDLVERRLLRVELGVERARARVLQTLRPAGRRRRHHLGRQPPRGDRAAATAR